MTTTAKRDLVLGRGSPSAALVSRLIPAAVAIPVVVAAVMLAELHRSRLTTPVVLLLTTASVAIGIGLLLATAASIARLDRQRSGAEAALQRSEARYRALARSFPAGAVVLFDRDLRHLVAGGSGLAVVGLSPELMEGRTIWEVFPDEVCDTIEAPYRRALEGHESALEVEYRDRTYAVRVEPVPDEETGVIWGGAVAVVDVTDLKLTERELRDSEARLAEAQRTARIGSWDWDVVTDEVVWSDELFRIWGLDRSSVGLLTYAIYQDTIHPLDRDAAHAAVTGAMDTGRPFSVEHRIIRQDGSLRWIHGRGEVERRDGSPVRLHGTAQDVTERIEAEHQLRETESRYRILVEQLPLVTYVRPLDMSVANLYCSPNVEELLGYTAREWESDPGLLARIVHPDDVAHVLSEGARVRTTGVPFRGEYRYLHRDGHVVWVQDETYLIRDESGEPTGVQGYLLDITERRLAEEERDHLQGELQHAQKLEAIGQLAGGVAHEFNNTLTAIRGYATLVHEQLAEDSPLRRDVRQILASAERAAALTRQLLAFGRKQVLNPRAIDLNAVTETSVDLLRPLLDPGIVLVTSLDAAIPPTRADPAQIEQVLVNLVLNASDAITERGTITVTTSLEQVDAATAAQHAVSPGAYVALAVADTGCGMDAGVRARLFEPFFTTKEEGKGTGLGLSTAYGLARQGGGFLAVDSTPGSGTTMSMHLPLRPSTSPASPSEPVRPTRASRGGVAIVVDDERAVRTVCAALLTRIGFRTCEARDAEEALSLLETLDDVEVVLTDVVMPGVDGAELALEISRRSPDTAVVTMSGYPGEAKATRGVFLQKPFTVQELEQRIDEALATVPARTQPSQRRPVMGR